MFETRSAHHHSLKTWLFIMFGILTASAHAATRVAVIDDGIDSNGTEWCSFLNANGYECILFPASGPTTSLDAFAVVINMSEEWADPGHTLADFLQSGKGVIT